MPGWTIRPPGILAKGFFICAGMSTLQNYSCCSSKGVVDVKKPAKLKISVVEKQNKKLIFYFYIRDRHNTKTSAPSSSEISHYSLHRKKKTHHKML